MQSAITPNSPCNSKLLLFSAAFNKRFFKDQELTAYIATHLVLLVEATSSKKPKASSTQATVVAENGTATIVASMDEA